MSEIYNRTFIASSENFSGFKVQIDIRRINTLQDIVDIFLRELTSILKIHNFEVLMDKLKYGNSWHIHTHTLEQILIGDSNSVYYVCNHCK
jgi:hypothetical protein|tara:strand:- start:956 stop:1228 length:273 start_codon:yes stop_codon:yes gene_type:complete